MYSYSRRLAWSLSSNSFSRLMSEQRLSGVPLLDLTVSNPTQVLSDYPHAALAQAYAAISDFTYFPNPCGLDDARLALVNYYANCGVALSPSQLFLTASTSEAYSLLFKLFCNPEDEVLVPIPSYPLFEYLAALECIRIVPYRLLYDGSWFIDFADLRNRLSERTRAIVLVNPNNPTGSFLKTSEAEKLIELAGHGNLPLISDEVFSHYSFGNPADRVTTLIGQNAVLSFSLNGLSKLACMPQMKIGWIAINGPEEERDIARQRLELLLDTYLSVSTPAQKILARLLSIGIAIRERMTERAKQNLNLLHHILAGTSAHPLHSEGGWSAIIQLPNTASEEAWTTRLLAEQRVIVQPGFFFDLSSEPYIVVSLITPLEHFTEGIRRLRRILC